MYKREAYQSHMQIPFAVALVSGRPTAPAPNRFTQSTPVAAGQQATKGTKYSLCTPADMFKIDHDSLSYSTKNSNSCDLVQQGRTASTA